MDRLLNRNTASDEDYYALLGCGENSSEEQIATEYKQLVRKCHPDKVPEERQAEAKEMFLKIEKAKETLLDKKKRAKYDEWRLGGFNVVLSFDKWMAMQPRVHTSMHWAAPEKPIPALPEATSQPTPGSTESRQDERPSPSSLEEFRRGQGSSSSSRLNNFRDYSV